jgi:hypothetical protein
MYETQIPFSTYIRRIVDHCDWDDDFHDIIILLEDNYNFYNSHSTFMHGDLSLDNLIQTDKGLYFIDPIYNEDSWSSYLLDITKLLHSYRRYNRMFEYEIFINMWAKKLSNTSTPHWDANNISEEKTKYFLQLLEITQWIRVVKYIPDQKVKKEFHDKTKQMINSIIKNKKI